MVIIVKWSDEAKETFDDNIQFLLEQWTEREIINFIKATNENTEHRNESKNL